MDIKTLQQYFESPAFASNTGVVSSIESFMHAVVKDPMFHHLCNLLEHKKHRLQVRLRLHSLLDQRPTVTYGHDHDLPIACYFMALSLVGAPGWQTDGAVLSADKTLWWSRHVAAKILTP